MSESDYRVPALERGLNLLGLFNARQRSLGMNEMAERLGVSPSALYRIVQTLQDMGYLNRLERNQYELGARVISDGFAYLSSRDIVEIALPHLNALRDSTSLSCHLSIREQTDSLYIYRAFAPQRLTVNIPVGTRLPCHVTALGRVLLTALDEDGLAQLYQQVRLDDYPPPAPRTLLELQHTIAEDRERGWVLHRSDYSTAIATAIRDRSGQVVAAINLSGPEAVLATPSAEGRYLGLLRETAAAISAELVL
ncbi:DNA-binding IclR family transcriptional regulator [Pseudomonas citronellolis]|uniref:IclR family transcriptional regulator n=1 Tax=Pseudomonas citronellolis TaxID=53408 RepID=UPI0020A047ED|nr:IclR family transcriptional regulator [Pseudomonas citronellolis]MCP1644364.1 DNA-binding IclR family transcriptional regulator [Pseudomonas citronellolis]MCP1667175.1 DNA-binding IclR family transcriptional regulator [Pseudomonas citronellolis]MCP1698252.1 DNA-binding IclR family transcriptional regulator [Pseudomonas citronellolis]MCP1705165.1 DNA-binding IclR family transcriptional regulator [Pseudomonas citronellolis]MCP1798788.1 DNA-binding IclR family transcriptional regulator [Pseudo